MATYRQERVNCGKPTCEGCKAGPSHGPYWYAYWRDFSGGLRKAYMGATLPRDAGEERKGDAPPGREKSDERKRTRCEDHRRAPARSPLQILGLPERPAPSWAAIVKAYKRRAVETHPDRGGSTSDMVRVNAAFETLRREHGK